MSTTYDNILAMDTTYAFHVPKDFYSALNEATDTAGEQAIVELDAEIQLYIFEFSRITKTGGSTTPSSPWTGQGSRSPMP